MFLLDLPNHPISNIGLINNRISYKLIRKPLVQYLSHILKTIIQCIVRSLCTAVIVNVPYSSHKCYVEFYSQ